jgi:hypothetical protein
MNDLTDRERAILDFAGRWYKYAGKQEQDIRDLFDCSATRYFLTLNGLLDRAEALAYAPTTVNRLRRQRAQRQAVRSARRLGVAL